MLVLGFGQSCQSMVRATDDTCTPRPSLNLIILPSIPISALSSQLSAGTLPTATAGRALCATDQLEPSGDMMPGWLIQLLCLVTSDLSVSCPPR